MVLLTAVVILLISLIFIGVMLSYSKDANWPPIVPACPDYWTMNSDGKCVNSQNLGSCTDPMDFKDKSMCDKYNWAKDTCKVSWDGITYGYGTTKPCSS